MVVLACIGLFFIVLSGIINAIELKKFFRALAILNNNTKTIGDKCMYPIRLISITRFAAPLIPDAILMIGAGSIGLGGGVLGSIIAVGGTCMVTLIIKAALKSARKGIIPSRNYEEAMAKL